MKNSRGRDSRDRGSRGGDFGQRSQMHDAICAECGQQCQVPFRPSGDKPVYCSNCFTKRQGAEPRRPEGRDFRRSDFRDKKMYSAICDKCGQQCQVPFQPTQGKPIFCDQCFGKERGGENKGGKINNEHQLVSINAKLDKIINALIVAKLIEPKAEDKKAKPEKTAPSKEAKKAAPEKVAPVKEVKKKPAAKKVASKKAAKKK